MDLKQPLYNIPSQDKITVDQDIESSLSKKDKKGVFMLLIAYPDVRKCLLERGWREETNKNA